MANKWTILRDGAVIYSAETEDGQLSYDFPGNYEGYDIEYTVLYENDNGCGVTTVTVNKCTSEGFCTCEDFDFQLYELEDMDWWFPASGKTITIPYTSTDGCYLSKHSFLHLEDYPWFHLSVVSNNEITVTVDKNDGENVREFELKFDTSMGVDCPVTLISQESCSDGDCGDTEDPDPQPTECACSSFVVNEVVTSITSNGNAVTAATVLHSCGSVSAVCVSDLDTGATRYFSATTSSTAGGTNVVVSAKQRLYSGSITGRITLEMKDDDNKSLCYKNVSVEQQGTTTPCPCQCDSITWPDTEELVWSSDDTSEKHIYITPPDCGLDTWSGKFTVSDEFTVTSGISGTQIDIKVKPNSINESGEPISGTLVMGLVTCDLICANVKGVVLTQSAKEEPICSAEENLSYTMSAQTWYCEQVDWVKVGDATYTCGSVNAYTYSTSWLEVSAKTVGDNTVEVYARTKDGMRNTSSESGWNGSVYVAFDGGEGYVEQSDAAAIRVDMCEEPCNITISASTTTLSCDIDNNITFIIVE